MAEGRVMCYVQHLMGIGHQRRTAAIARAMCALDLEVTYVSGGYPVAHLDTGCAHFVQLPPARSPDMSYTGLVNDKGEPVDESWKAHRSAALLEAFHRCKPDALLIETFPFGRRLLRFELLPLLDAVHMTQPRPRVACSVRDILENRPKPGKHEAIAELVNRYFDRVLVHSDPGFVTLDATYPLAGSMQDKISYTGYVMDGGTAVSGAHHGRGEVIVSAGGGAFGEHVLRTALQAQPLSSLKNATWRILVGHNLPEERFQKLGRLASAACVVERNRPDFSTLLRNCAVSVSQGGYNTVLEVLHARARAVIVPYSDEREQEQAVRARLLCRRAGLQVVPNRELSPARLASAVDAALDGPEPGHVGIDLDGAEISARAVASLAGGSFPAHRRF